MSKKSSRMTKQKKTILDVLYNTDQHPTADWIYQEARKSITDISLGTVYRNLRILKEEGKIMELNYGSSYSRYDGKAENHYHFVCNNCGKVFDVNSSILKNIEKEFEKKIEGTVIGHRLEFYGYCIDCQQIQ